MDKYKVLKKFRDKHSKDIYEVDQQIELTEERAAEVEKNLDSSFLELLPDKEAVEVEHGMEPKETAEAELETEVQEAAESKKKAKKNTSKKG